jgi:hypothetical protein
MFGIDWRGLLDTGRDYAGRGMDYISEQLPDREYMKSLIEGDTDDKVIDYVGDKWNQLRGLLDPRPTPYPGMDYNPMGEYERLNPNMLQSEGDYYVPDQAQSYVPVAEEMMTRPRPKMMDVLQQVQEDRDRMQEGWQNSYYATEEMRRPQAIQQTTRKVADLFKRPGQGWQGDYYAIEELRRPTPIAEEATIQPMQGDPARSLEYMDRIRRMRQLEMMNAAGQGRLRASQRSQLAPPVPPMPNPYPTLPSDRNAALRGF